MSAEASLSAGALLLGFLIVGFASTIKAAIGFGFPLIAVPLLSNLLDPRTAVTVMSIPVFLSNLPLIARGGGSPEALRRMGLILATLIAGTIVGAQLLAVLDLRILSLLVGLSAIGFVALNVSGADLSSVVRRDRVVSPVLGLTAGVMGGVTNVNGPLMAAYLHSLRLPKKEFVFSMTVFFLVGNGTQVVSYFQLGLYTGPILWLALLAGIPTALGITLGLRLQERLSPRVWSRIVLMVIFLSGLNLLFRAAAG